MKWHPSHFWTLLFVCAFMAIGAVAIRHTLLTHKQQKDLQIKNQRENLEQFVKVWEKGVLAQLNFWCQNSENKEDLTEHIEQWQKQTPWLDAVFVWDDEQLHYPSISLQPIEHECFQQPVEEQDCSLASIDVQNRSSLTTAQYWYERQHYQLAQFAIISNIPNIKATINELDLSDSAIKDFFARRTLLYKTEIQSSVQSGGQALVGQSLQELMHLSPEFLPFVLEDLSDIMDFTPLEIQKQIQRLQRRMNNFQQIQQLQSQEPKNAELELYIQNNDTPIIIAHKETINHQHLAITLDAQTLMQTLTNQHHSDNPNSREHPYILDVEGNILLPLVQETNIDIQIPGSIFFPHLRIGMPLPIQPKSVWYQLLFTLLPITLAGSLGIFAIIGSIRADQKQIEFIQRQQAFIARVTHEFKTPLAGIQLMAQALEMGMLEDPEQGKMCVEKILEESKRLEQRIDEILQVAKQTEIRKMSLLDSDIVSLELYEIWAHRFEEINGTLRISEGHCEFYADYDLLKDAISNLLSNAIKYRNPQKKLRCVLSIKPHGKWLEIIVTDNGMGVPVVDRKRIFERFVRVEGDNRGFAGGHGLGLAFVAETAKAHNGTVTCEDGANGGSKFVMKIALKQKI